MPNYNLNNNQSLIPSSSQQPVIPSQGPLERPPISIEMQLTEAVERDKAATVYSLLQEVVEPTTRRNAYLLAYHLGHINAALVLLKAGVPLIGSLETLAYNAICQQKYDVVSFDNLSAYIRQHGLSFNPDSRHGPKQESLQECATRTGTRLALAWFDQFRIDAEGVSNQYGLHQPQLGLQDPISSLDNFDDPWGFLTGLEAFEEELDLDEFPNLLLIPSDLDFDHTLQPNIPAAPLVSSSAQSLNESSNSTPANFIDLTLADDIHELPDLSLDRIRSTQEIDQLDKDWSSALSERNCSTMRSLLQEARQKNIQLNVDAKLSSFLETPLHLACESGDSELVRLLIAAKADIHAKDQNGYTPFYAACCRGHGDVVKQLIAANVNINDKNPRGSTALHAACTFGHTNVVRQLLAAGASIEAKIANGKTPLDVAFKREIQQLLENARAAQQASLQPPPSQQEIDQFNKDWSSAFSARYCSMMRSLLQEAGQKNIQLNVDAKLSSSLQTPLHLACASGDSELVRLLIAANADIHAKDQDGYTPFYLACCTGHGDVVKQLIAANANINDKNRNGSTALHQVCRYGNTDLVSQLLEAGASIDAKNANGKIPLDVARKPAIRQLLENARAAQQASLQPPPSQQEIDKFNRDWLTALSEKNCRKLHSLLQESRQKRIPCNLDAKNKDEDSAMHLGCIYGHSQLVQLLIESKANLTVKDKDLNSPLHLACRNGNIEVVRQLIEAKANIDDQCRHRNTPLHTACLYGHLKVAKLLIKANADINAKGDYVNTPLHVASGEGYSEIVTLLIQSNAVVNYLNRHGNSPLHLACREGHSNVVKQLLAARAIIDGKNKKGETPFQLAKTPGILQLLENARAAQQASLQQPPSQQEIDKFNRDWLTALSGKNCSKLHSLLQEARQKKIPCNLDAKNKDEDSAMHLGCIYGHSQLVQLLIESKANLNVKDKYLYTPLHWACNNGHIEAVRLLIAAKANLNVKDVHLYSPLHLACSYGHIEAVRLLIEAKANINDQDTYGDTPLHNACRARHLEIARQLLAAGAIIDRKNRRGETPFQLAKTPEILQLLENARAAQQASLQLTPSQQEFDQLDKDWHSALSERSCSKLLSLLQQARQRNILLNVNAKLPGFLTSPLHLACERGDSELVRLLIAAKADIHAKDKDGYFPFYLACSGRHCDVVKQLIDANVNINDKTRSGSTALHAACGFGNTDVVRQLLAAGALIDAKDANGNTPLDIAITPGILQLLENARAAQQASLQSPPSQQEIDQFSRDWLSAISEKNCDKLLSLLQQVKQKRIPLNVSLLSVECGYTPLFIASAKGHSELVRELIEANASVNLASYNRLTPLHVACREGHSEVVGQLIEAEANLNIKDIEQRSPLHLACRNGHIEVVRLLIKAKTNINDLDKDKGTPLHEACFMGHLQVAELLIKAGADINAKDRNGNTPLHDASSRGYSEIVKLLIDAKADIHAKDKEGYTPFHLACCNERGDVVKQLIAAKANINDKNRRGSTALHLVCRNRNTDLVSQLLEAGASIDAKNAKGKIPLDVARSNRIRQLLENARAAQQASLQPPPSQQEIDQLQGDWVKAFSERQFDKMLLLLQNAKQKKIPLNVDLLSGGGNTPLYLATSKGHSELVRELIEANASVNLANKEGLTPLHFACWEGLSEIVRQLLAAGASIDAKSNIGKTPLDAASTPEIRQLLENARAAQQASLQPHCSQQEIDQLNRDWLTALSHRNCDNLLSLLQQARQKGISFDVNVKINNDYNALHLACSKGHSELVRLLIEAKANINDLDKDRDTPLHEACLKGYLQAAELLIKAGADINAKGQFGNTPLHDASCGGRSETVKFLIQEKANVKHLNTDRNSPLHLACREGHSDIARQLLAAGAVANEKNKAGKTPFDVAKTPEIRQLLEAARLNANSRTDAPSQSRTPNPRKLERAGKSLLKRVAEHYGPRYHTALTDLLIKNKGRWGIDFARYSPRRIDKSEWLAPFVQFLEAHPRSETAFQVVKQHLAFFQFSDSSDRGTLTDDQSSAESFVEDCLKQNARQPRESQAPLSDYFAVEACQTLFSLKLREWDYMVNHPERYFPASERLTDASRAPCPCFILAQDQNQVRAHVMQAHFGKTGFVESFGKDDRQEALRFLFTEILKHSEVPSDRIREDESVVLSWEEYNTLERYLAELPPSDLPRLLVPMREKLVQPIEEVSETDSSGDDVESASDEEPSYRRERDREERPAKRRERSPTEGLEQHSSLESFLSFNDLIGSRSSEKRTTRENDGVSSEGKRHRKNAYEVPEHEGAFVPLEEQLIPFLADVRSKRQRRGKEGEIPEVGSFAGLPSLNDDPAFAFSDNPYDALNRTSIKKIKEAVAREVARESVVLRQIKPYSYPIVDKLSDLPAAKPSFSWTRALKPYQQETLQDLLRYDSHGLSKLLSLEMGLGKTYVFAEFLIDKIAKSPSPQLHVVSAPVSVVGQVQQELSKLLLEASITAWQLTGKRPAGPHLWPQCKQLLDYANNHPDALKSVLRVLPYFKDAHVYGVPASNQFFSQPGLQGQLFSMIQEHLVEIETLLQERPEEREQFEAQLNAVCKDLNLTTRSKSALLYYFKTSQPIAKLCNIAGRILDLYPGRKELGEPLPICSDQELTSLRNLGLSPSQIEKEHFINAWTEKKLDPELKSLSDTPTAPKICMIGLKDLHRLRDQFPRKHVGSLIIDEANRAQNPHLATSRQLRETIASFRESAFESSDSSNILLVTGTPFENNLNELWNLLEMSNANHLLPRSTCNSLMKDTLLTTIKQMINLCEKGSKANEDLIEQYVLISFAQFMGLRNMVQQMVHRKDTSDPQVIEDWKGRIPSKTIRKILYELDPQMRDYLNEVQEGRRAISQRSVQTQILIHPDLAGQSLDAQENNRWPFLEPFRTGSDEAKEAWIKSSPYLSAVLTDAVFQAAMNANQKRIIFCDRNALSAAFKETIKHFYQHAKVIIYNGDLNRLERDKAIAKFKNESSDHPTVLIAMIKAGGVGLNLAEADGRHICATQWNEGQKRQADARLIRANNVGEKDMPEIEFPETYYSAHPKAIRKKKRNWENFLWNSSASPKDLFQTWTTVLKAETLQVLLNTTIEDGNRRNTESAKAKNQQISDLLDRFSDSVPEDRLRRAISLAMGPSGSAGIEQSSSPTELSDDPATSSSEEERTPSSSELSDDVAPAPAALSNAPIGLGNKSNNCWCNALLQMVASVPSLRASYESFARHYIPNAAASSFGIAASSSSPQRSYLDEYYGQLMLSALDLYDQSEEALPYDISQNVREALHHFSSGAISISSSHDEDAYEALSILLQGSDPGSSLYTPLSTIRTYSPLPGLPALADRTKLANNEYSKLEDGNRSTMTTAVPEILLPLQGNETPAFSYLLRQFFDSPALPDTPPATYLKGIGLFKYQLQRIQNQFQSVPNEFLLQLGRFRKEGPQDDPILHKVNTPVAVPLVLTLPPEAFASPITPPPSYHLDSFIVHSGDLEGGHYFTYKKLEGQWWLCNDSHVEPVALQDIEGILSGGMTTYLHHYTRHT